MNHALYVTDSMVLRNLEWFFPFASSSSEFLLLPLLKFLLLSLLLTFFCAHSYFFLFTHSFHLFLLVNNSTAINVTATLKYIAYFVSLFKKKRLIFCALLLLLKRYNTKIKKNEYHININFHRVNDNLDV